MSHKKIGLASDNWAPAHPWVLEAIGDANVGDAPLMGLIGGQKRGQS